MLVFRQLRSYLDSSAVAALAAPVAAAVVRACAERARTQCCVHSLSAMCTRGLAQLTVIVFLGRLN